MSDEPDQEFPEGYGSCEKCGKPVAYDGDTLCPNCESSDPRFVG